MTKKLVVAIKIAQCLLNIILPTAAVYLIVGKQDIYQFNGIIFYLLNIFIFVSIFLMYMQILYYYSLSNKLSSLLFSFLLPFFTSFIDWFVYKTSTLDILINLSFVYLASMMISFFLIVWVRHFENFYQNYRVKINVKNIFFPILISLAQTIFLAPGLSACYAFIYVILFSSDFNIWSIIFKLGLLAAPLYVNVAKTYEVMSAANEINS